MKNNSLPVKRNPVRKSQGIFRRISAVTNRQRAATTTAEDLEFDESGSGVSRAITILFLIHILAIGLFFVHQKFLEGRTAGRETTEAKPVEMAPAPVKHEELPKFAPGTRTIIVGTGDNYEKIAKREQVDEADLRAMNIGIAIAPGRIIGIPPRKIVAELPPEIAKFRTSASPDADSGLVEAVDVANAPKAVLVKPAARPAAVSRPQETNNTKARKWHEIKPGENLWRIAAKYGTTPETLKKANGIQDERKLQPGTKLAVP